MLELSRTNPVVNSFRKLGERDGFTAVLFEQLALQLATRNDELTSQLVEVAMRPPAPVFIPALSAEVFRSELTDWGHKEALRLAEEEARDVNDIFTRYRLAGVPVRVVMGVSGWLTIDALPARRRDR